MIKTVEIDHDGKEHETDKAILFRIQSEDVWIAKSLIEYEDDDIVEIPEWLAIEKELI